MTEEKKYPDEIKFLDNLPQTVELLFDKPSTGISQKTGKPWIKYGCTGNTFFWATELLHKTLIMSKVGKGTKARITLKQRTDDKKKKFWEVTVNGQTVTSDGLDSVKTGNEVAKVQEEAQQTKDYYGNTENLIDMAEQIWKRFEKGQVIPPDSIEKMTVCVFTSATINKTKPPKKSETQKAIEKELDGEEIPPPNENDMPPDLPF